MSRFEGYVKLLKNIITITTFYQLQLNFYRLVSKFTNYPNNFGWVCAPHTPLPVARALIAANEGAVRSAVGSQPAASHRKGGTTLDPTPKSVEIAGEAIFGVLLS